MKFFFIPPTHRHFLRTPFFAIEIPIDLMSLLSVLFRSFEVYSEKKFTDKLTMNYDAGESLAGS